MRADLSASEHEGPNMEGAGKARRRGERGFVSVGWEWYVHIALSGLRARMGWGGAGCRVGGLLCSVLVWRTHEGAEKSELNADDTAVLCGKVCTGTPCSGIE